MSRGHEGRDGGLLHWIFESSLLIKSVLALFEIAAGLGLRLLPHPRLAEFAAWLSRNALIEPREGPVFSRLEAGLTNFSSASQNFYAYYLIGHGGIKLAVLLMLMRRIGFAYPLGIAVFLLFIAMQMHRWTLTQSPLLLALSVLDALVVWLTWREWRLSQG